MAGNTFYLKIISANRVFFSGRCRSLIVPEYDGQKEILAHHEDMVIAIDEGEMRFQPEGTDNWEYAVVGMGFVEIVNNRVTLLVETAERPEEIDVARAREAKERAEEQMRQKQSIREYYHSRQSPRLFAEDFSVLKRLKVSIFKTFQSLFGIIKVSKKAVLFYDDTRNRKSKKANADGMY